MPNEVEIKITADDLTGPAFASVLAKVAALKRAMKDASGAFSPDMSVGAMTSSLLLLKQKMQALGVADIADINQSPGRIMSQMQLLKRLIQQAGISDLLDMNLNESTLTSQIAKVKSITAQGIDIPINWTNALPIGGPFSSVTAPGDPALTNATNSLTKATDQMILATYSLVPATYRLTGETDSLIDATNRLTNATMLDVRKHGSSTPGVVAGAASGAGAGAASGSSGGGNGVPWLTASLAAYAAQAVRSTSATNALIGRGGSGGGGGAGFLGLGAAAGWAAKQPLFNATWRGWGTTVGGIQAWHIVLDAFIEGAIIAVSSIAALAAAAEALGGTAVNLYQHLQAVYTVNSALGSRIPPLTDRFLSLQKALAPQGIEIYGAALNAINMEAGSMAKALVPVTNMLTTMAAKFDLWLKGFGSTGKIFTAGIGFLTQLGGILGTVGAGIGNLVKDDPGIARFLLDFIQGIASSFNWLTKLPGPLVEFTLLLHGAYVWGSVIVGLLGRLGAGLAKMWGNLLVFAGNPWAWVAIGAAAFAYLAVTANEADAATKAFIDQQNAGLGQLSGWQAFAQSISDVGVDFHKIQGINWQTVGAGMSTWQQTLTLARYDARQLYDGLAGIVSFSPHSFTHLGNFITSLFGSNKAFTQAAQNDVDAYLNQIKKLEGQQQGMIGALGNTVKMGYNVAQSWALLSLAGVKLGDSVAIATQKVKNLLAGYQNLSIRGGILANSVNAVTFSSLQQQSQVTALNQAWSGFISMLTGGVNDLGAFNTALKGITGSKAGALGSTFAGNFANAVNSASALAQQLTVLASASGLGTRGTTILSNSVKDMVAQLIPAASQVHGLIPLLYGLAQEGGYKGADALHQIAKWAQFGVNPSRNLNRMLTILEGTSSNLAKDVKNLSDALGTTLNNAMATAIFAATGGQKSFDNFATSVLHAHGNIHDMIRPAANLAYTLIQTTGSVSQAKGEFFTFGGALGIPIGQLKTLWKWALQAQAAIDRMHGTTITNTINTYDNTYGNTNQPSPPGSPTRKKRAGGGVAGGWTVVGEYGPELVNLPQGSTVRSHSDTMAMIGASGPPRVEIVVKYDKSLTRGLSPSQISDLKWTVRTIGGGDVQAAFGEASE